MNELYLRYRDKKIFTKKDVLLDFNISVNATNRKIYHAKESGLIKGIQSRSIYFIVEPGEDYDKAHADIYLLANKLAEDSIICYASALMSLGKSHSIINTIYISCKDRFLPIKYGKVTYKKVSLLERTVGIETKQYKGASISVTSLERTLIDCLRVLKYSGGFEHLYKSYEGVKYLNWEKLELYLESFSSPLLNARVGFFVEKFKDAWRIPNNFYIKLRRSIPKSPDYFEGRSRKGGILVHRWNLIVPKYYLSY